MKREKQKKQRPGRKKINKNISSIAKAQAGSLKQHTRRSVRMHMQFPNSSKVGAGSITARRSLPNDILHRRNHRDNEIIGYKY